MSRAFIACLVSAVLVLRVAPDLLHVLPLVLRHHLNVVSVLLVQILSDEETILLCSWLVGALAGACGWLGTRLCCF